MRKGKSYVLQLADKEVDFCGTFKLFCTTRLPNPHFTPELSAKVTVVDFTGAARRCLALAVHHLALGWLGAACRSLASGSLRLCSDQLASSRPLLRTALSTPPVTSRLQ